MTALTNSSVGVVDQSLKSKSTWYASTLKGLSCLRSVLTKLSLLWHHPIVTLLVLLLFTPPMQPILKFFSPLIVFTFLCMVAFISFGSPMDKIKEREAHIRIEDEIAGMDMLGWAAFMHHGFQPDSMLKPEGDPNSWMEKIKKNSYVQTHDDTFVANVLGRDRDFQSDSSLMKRIGLSFLTEQMKDGKLSHAKFEDDFAQMDGLERDGSWAAQTYDELQPDNYNLRQKGSLRSWTEPVSERKPQSRNLVKLEDDIAGMDGQGGDGRNWSRQIHDGLQSDTNPKQDDFYSFVTEEMKESETRVHIDVPASGPGKDRQLYDGFRQERNLKHEDIIENISMTKTEIQIEEEIARIDMAPKPYHGFQPDRNPKHECGLKQQIDTQDLQIEDKIAGMDVPDHKFFLGAELYDKFQPYNGQKQEDDPNGLIPQRWRDWVRGVETDGLSIWTPENKLLKKFDEKTLCTNFNQDITGIVALEEEFMSDGAFAAADENGGVLLEELSAFIQELTVKLQSFGEFEAEMGQTGSLNKFSDQKDINLACNMNDPTGLKLAGFSPPVETLDDSNTEQGDESSRWDEALDSEKESLDSENGEGSIWPRASDVSDMGATVTEKEIKSLKQEYITLEEECKLLQDENNFRYSEQKTETWQTAENGEDSDDSFDPYVRLFAQAASDAEDEGPCLHRHPEHQRLTSPKKISLKIEDKSTDSLFRKQRLCFICRAIKAIRRKRL